MLVGEIRDFETANISIEAALTGHLVLSTLHTNDAPSALTRLTEIGCEPFLVATALSAVIAQRLARRLCMRCREPLVEPTEVLDVARLPARPQRPAAAVQGGRMPGVLGHRLPRPRRAARGHDAERRDRVSSSSRARRAARSASVALEQGMVSLREDGWSKVAQGLTTIEEVLRVSV